MNAKRGWTLEPYFFERDNVMEKFAVCVKNGSKTINVEIVVRRCSSKQVFLIISQISQENPCVGVSF